MIDIEVTCNDILRALSVGIHPKKSYDIWMVELADYVGIKYEIYIKSRYKTKQKGNDKNDYEKRREKEIILDLLQHRCFAFEFL